MKFSLKLIALITLFSFSGLFAQRNLSHEVGLTFGPIFMQTDYGQANHLPSSTPTSFGISLSHYLSFYGSNYNWRNGSSYFSDHFKLKTDFSFYTNSDLEHKGEYAKLQNDLGARLRAMTGTTKLWDVGMQMEYYFKNLEDYGLLFNDNDKFAPYVSAGLHFSKFTPTLTTTHNGGDYVNNPEGTLPGPWQVDAVFLEPDTTFSLTLSAGTRYKLGDVQLVLDARWQYFFSDRIEGLDAPHELSGSKHNDTLIFLSFGAVYDLGSF
ncbi:MAG: outer membrane beta-barrel protein [Flavobacteriaceae bacterium]|jgi:opacity protein-like surface antigen|nr:outer membrane beta-barrel protein [Flavobacteriaceae bacterium]